MCDFILREYDIFLKKYIPICGMYGGKCSAKCRANSED